MRKAAWLKIHHDERNTIRCAKSANPNLDSVMGDGQTQLLYLLKGDLYNGT